MGISAATSIREKINRIVLAATLASLLLAGLALAAFDLLRQYRAVRSDLFTQADVLALTSQAALSFNDPKAASEYLNSLQAKPSIASAALYAAGGGLFAQYRQPDANVPVPTVAPLGVSRLDFTYLQVVRPVEGERERLGYIYIRARHGLLTRLLESLGALGAIMTLSLAGGYWFSNRLQRQVTEPVMEISAVARQVLRGDTHAVRAEKRSNDEVGDLVEAFNAMLAELGARADRLEEANLAKDRFLATLAHELRNPLAPIRTGLEILKKDPGNGPRAERVRATMERQLTHMIHLIDDLLDIARVNTGKFNLDRRRVTLATVVDAAVEACRPGIDTREQGLEVQLPERQVWLNIDPVRMTQALGNLIGNASKYTQQGGSIRVQARVDAQDGVVLSVWDNGMGIPAESQGQVFDLFAQVKTAQDRSEGGLGIGLFLVRSVVELHGGVVSVASEGPGRGTEFRVSLPPSVILDAAPEGGTVAA